MGLKCFANLGHVDDSLHALWHPPCPYGRGFPHLRQVVGVVGLRFDAGGHSMY